ncbi:enoyl-CoA hydratase/isomerase family protein [Salinisphaera sp.]|uniref:enoyl-CoA hydratase/isomerase family protein n=1 Tax=Salinisphaera sp. TaxID=1914330 RepID=UPI002D770AE1|nr:enoyl-CoA hydratase-related protein [Salinisphaera sp.]HET7312755.1 enoyl-CoA hydratase-related protein [Salinisphaera sp.]
MAQPDLQSGCVRAAIDAHILRITLDRADKRNALTRAMYNDLTSALDAGRDDPDVRVIVLDGEGEMFCAGNDIADFAHVDLSSGDAGATGPALTFIRHMIECDKPIVVAVQGQATGIGTTLLLHADLVVAADDARFYTAFIDLGLVPEAGSSRLLPALLGRQNAARLLLAGDTLTAADAERLGLIAYRVPAADLAERTRELATRLAAKPPGAMAASKRLLRQGMATDTLIDQIEREAEVFGERLASAEVREIMNAFLNRKKR